MHFNVKEEIIALTPQWKGERFDDGRPKVADKYLKALDKAELLESVQKKDAAGHVRTHYYPKGGY